MIEKLGITPGPWSVPHFANPDSRCDCGYIFCDPSGNTICEVFYKRDKDRYSEHRGRQEASANARLIATAPEMLGALIKVYNNRGEADKLYIIADRLKPIIEKATGKTWEEIRGLIDG